ncbi:UNVERIFIED_CONTAM: hypothetical protein Slati_4444100 [Sesamum latifolium]|uniref:Uncharacterized protein n=1 Tax=Sesamum latifolium TaxID=2727402 RepID=A0AAW2SQQ6_9LAMI
MNKLSSEAFNIIDEIATNLYSYGLERTDNRIAGIHSVDAVTALSAQMVALTQKMDNFGAAMRNFAPTGPYDAYGQMGPFGQDCLISIHTPTHTTRDGGATLIFHRVIINSKGRQMPSYVKFLKEVISNKRKCEGGESVKLNEECSAILQNKLLPKLKDSGSFSIPCTIENTDFDKALCDLGASVNLMSYSIFEKLGMHELTLTIITLQQADRSIKYPMEIVEDVLVKVEKFIIPVDFIVLDMEEDVNMPLILGRPFLATSRALIDVQKGQLTLRVNDEHKRGMNLIGRRDRGTKPTRMVDCTRNIQRHGMKNKKFKDGDKRHHKNKGPIKVDWSTAVVGPSLLLAPLLLAPPRDYTVATNARCFAPFLSSAVLALCPIIVRYC